MCTIRSIFLVLLMLVSCTTVLAQRPGPQFRRPLACEPLEPRTKLEAIEAQYETVLVKGFSQIATLNVRGGDIRIDAIEMKNTSGSARSTGIVVALRDSGERPRENRAFIDYEEIDPLIKAFDSVAKVNESITKLAGFEARYRTVGDLDINVFRQGRSGTAAALSTGICDKLTVLLTLDELERFKGIILEAKNRLGEIR
jgi:hypothetical protein